MGILLYLMVKSYYIYDKVMSSILIYNTNKKTIKNMDLNKVKDYILDNPDNVENTTVLIQIAGMMTKYGLNFDNLKYKSKKSTNLPSEDKRSKLRKKRKK